MSIPFIDPIDEAGGVGGGGGGIGGTGGGGYIAPVSIVTTFLPIGNAGSDYFQYLNASDGYSPYTWSVSAGNLPVGLTLSSTGLISGSPTTAGTATFTVTVVDSANNTNSKVFSIQINEILPPTITTTSLSNVLINESYSTTILVTGGTVPYSNWSIIFGSLPNGLSLNNSTGTISGVPDLPGSYLFTVEVTDANGLKDVQSLTIVVKSPSPSILTTSFSDGITNASYTATITANGGTPPYSSWELLSGQLPQGLSLTGHSTNATISGIPSAVGNYSFTIKVTDSLGGFDTQILNLNIYDGQFPIISTIELPVGKIDELYNVTLIGAGGSLPYTWKISSGDLPDNLVLNTLTGVISGTPKKNGSYIFTLEITDKRGNKDTQILSLTIGNYLIPAITTISLPNTVVNKNYYKYTQAIGGKPPYSWSVDGQLPTGLSLDSDTGLISGIPTLEGTYNFSLSVIDDDNQSNTKSFTIQVGDGVSPTIINTAIDSAEKSIDYYQKLIAQGGTPSYQWSVAAGSLPNGIILSSDGILSGTPTTIGDYNFTIRVIDYQSRTDIQVFNLTVKSTGYDSRCCTCVFTNQIVDFSHNATDGVLTATGGTIINNKRWQAPSIEGYYNIDISVPSNNGFITVRNTINVIQKLELLGSSTITDILPRDNFTIDTNYSSDKIIWEVIGSDKSKIIPTSLNEFYVNTDARDNCFGSADVVLRGRLLRTDICDLTSTVDVRVKVDPVYPISKYCGPETTKWARESPDYRVISTEFDGGCDETHIRNKVPIIKWNLTYSGLPNFVENQVSVCQSCCNIGKTQCGCGVSKSSDIELNLNECNDNLKTSNRLDDFWNLVYGQFKTFTLVDQDTDEVWYNVRFADKMANDHVNRRTATSRNTQLVWKPCCNKSPAGGMCSRHGIVNYKNSYFNVSRTINIVTPAPTEGIVDDINNSFGWTIPSGYLLSDFEYTVDGGINISDALSNPLYVGDVNYGINKVGVRIKATSKRLASAWLFNTIPFATTDLNDTIPPVGSITQPTSDQTVSGIYIFRANATDLNGISSVEFFIDNNSIGTGTTYPYFISFDTTTLSNSFHNVYAKITDGSSSANIYITPNITFTTFNQVNITPLAPTNPITNDLANTFTFTPTSDIPVSGNNYEYSLTGINGSYITLTGSSPIIDVGNFDYAVGTVAVRVKAASGRNSSSALVNTVAFTAIADIPTVPANLTASTQVEDIPTVPANLTASTQVEDIPTVPANLTATQI